MMTTLQPDGQLAAPVVVAIDRLLWVGPLSIATSLVCVHAVRLIAINLMTLPSATPLGWIAPTADTVILCGLAIVVFLMVAGFADDGRRSWQLVAFGALMVSFIPLLTVVGIGRERSTEIAATLACMHIAAYIPCVTLLPKLALVVQPIADSRENVA